MRFILTILIALIVISCSRYNKWEKVDISTNSLGQMIVIGHYKGSLSLGLKIKQFLNAHDIIGGPSSGNSLGGSIEVREDQAIRAILLIEESTVSWNDKFKAISK